MFHTSITRTFSSRYHSFTRLPTINQLFNNIANKTIKDKDIIPELNCHIQGIKILKNVTFLDLFDGTSSQPLKLVIDNNVPNPILNKLKMGQAISLSKWIIVETPDRTQSFELSQNSDSKIEILGDVQDGYPLQSKQKLTVPYLRSIPLLKYKTNYFASLIRFRSLLQSQLIKILTNQDFIMCNPPILTSNDTEGNNETFKTIPKNLNLTVSTQLHLEILAQSLKNVFTISPCFRAEMSDTGRHLAEFWMLELESTNLYKLDDLLNCVKYLMINTAESLLEYKDIDSILPNNNLLPLNTLNKDQIKERWLHVANPNNWKHITYTEAVDILKEHHPGPPIWGESLSSEHEKFLAESYFDKDKGAFVLISQYPTNIKPFYMKHCSTNDKVVDCFDMIFPGGMGEVAGGSIREVDIDILQKSIGTDKATDLDWYVDLRRLGSMPRGGFGIGMERLISYLFGLQNVKDAIPFFRVMKDKISF
ncbi:similar to Saccharomyces cerevisiae YCR024C SLM5 Mitochondrial asparaginyl-tRNA synthetase [Maudiozyma saulgeensis]|uniref:asparagine--tRNA ligase n=1 Tax=Maudiozyma saulgeensis TaxID=1789683 RepID=A0A1X7R1C7_9SACH|nr:similar to Saccharomyces cerevisiae YCR024C SLM5 Mitochondrial asparaginyl-tRNA synthetase [Kazachstania saulgeensis]